ncbi:MAG: hypothetical protein MJ224_01700 [archaeon]|nr:hypothetical protein [archaeon]
MDEEFLEKYYIENEMYLENKPMNTKKFIKFCKERGTEITENELEKLEKGDLFYPIFRTKNKYRNGFYICSFNEANKKELKRKIKENTLYIPDKNNFQPFKEYHEKGKNDKTCSYYSAFQIYWLREIKNNLSKRQTSYNSPLQIEYFLKEIAGNPKPNKDPEKYLKSVKRKFNLIINLLIGIQIYSPYGRTNDRYIRVKNQKKFNNQLKKFNLEDVLSFYNVDIKYLINIYIILCRELPYFLGNGDMIQIWKHINWNKKDKFKGIIRLGIEYMQWTLMLKRCIEEYLDREIFDIDECTSMDAEYILNNDPEKEKDDIRGIRNEDYFNENTGTYEFNLNRKKLYYLANEFDLDYHPRVILFVEGDTEEEIIKKIFNEFYNTDIANTMIDIINIQGISKLFSGKISSKNENKKYKKLIISNYGYLINYLIHNFQVIPFFIGDNENQIIKLLMKGLVLHHTEKDEHYPLLENWIHIWDDDFELDNYTNEELTNAINKVCDLNIKPEEIQNLRDSKGKKGIKTLNEKIDENKKEINNKLIKDLKKSNDKKIFEKPIF